MHDLKPIGWVVLVQNSLAIFLGLITVGLVLGRGRGKLARRISVRFTLAISCVDVLKATAVLAFSFWDIEGGLGMAVSFFVMWLVLLYMFLNGMLALNLYLVFVRGSVFSERWTKYYFFGALFMATLPACIFNSAEWFGWGSEEDIAGEIITTWLCFKGWILGVCIFNSIIIYFALLKLWRHGCPRSTPCQTHRQIQSLVLRVVFLCSIPILTQLCDPIVYLMKVSNHNSEALKAFNTIATDSPGIFNFLLFLCDPSVKKPLDNLSRIFLTEIPNLPAQNSSTTDLNYHTQNTPSFLHSCDQEDAPISLFATRNVVVPSPVTLDSRVHEPGRSFSSSRSAALRHRYRSPVTYWPGTNIPIYNMVDGL